MKSQQLRFQNSKIYLLIFIVFCNNLIWMFSLPYNAPPDEGDHYLICNFIRKEGKLPVFAKDLKPYWMNHYSKLPVSDEEVRYVANLPKSMVPPFLYQIRFFPELIDPYLSYIFSAILMKLASFFTDNTFVYLFVARFISVIFGVMTVFFTFKIAQGIFPDKSHVAILSAAFVGFLPQATFISSYLNQDAFTAFVTTFVIYCALKCLDDRDLKYAPLLGCSVGLAILSKINCYVVLILSIFSLLILGRHNKRERIKIFLIVAACGLIVSGWFFLRNSFIYGQFWPRYLSDQLLKEFYASSPSEITRYAVLNNLMISNFKSLFFFLKILFCSFWGLFGWMSVMMPSDFYTLAFILTAFAVIGLIRASLSREFFDLKNRKHLMFLMLFGPSVVLIFIMVTWYSMQYAINPQGRYFFPAIAPIAIAFSLGWTALSRQEHHKQKIILFVITFLAGMNVYSFLFSVFGTYYFFTR